MADMFRKASFDVVDSRRDLKAQEMRRALREFTDKARAADIAVIYFAGHGLEVDGTNYVVPVDAVLERDADVDDEAVSLNRILMAAEPATRLRLVIHGDQQEPYTTNSLGGKDVALVPAPEKQQAPAATANAEMRHDYELAERVGTLEAWDSFMAAHPTGFYADLAKARRNKLAAETARVQATERAHQAAEEQARLAAEGAKAAEQTKAAQQAKEAEAARLAAEMRKRDEEARLAAAEAVKQAEQQRLAEEAKRLEQTKVATIEQPRAADQAAAAKPAEPAVAALAPADAKPAPQPPADLPRQLQTELKRVGCKSGEIDDVWSTSARKALSSFNDSAGTKFDVKLASLDALDAVRARQGRVCPLECDRGFHASGDHCVKITCDAGEVLGSNGACRRKPERAHKAVARERAHGPASGGRKCFVYSGTSFCE
jgi:hypothetical protein